MPKSAVLDNTHELLADGRLANLADWNTEVAGQLARRDGLTLSKDHWHVINAMRDYYQEYNVSPVLKLLKKSLQKTHGESLASDAVLEQLFPGGVLLQGSKLAGVPIPHLDAELERETYGSVRSGSVKSGSARSDSSAAASLSPLDGELEFEGKKYALSVHGNLIDLHRWSEGLAEYMAQKEGIKLSPDHWEVLNFLRKFYFEYGVAPMVKILMRELADELGTDRANREYLYGLFPQGPSRQGSRIAGLPEPQGCIDG